MNKSIVAVNSEIATDNDGQNVLVSQITSAIAGGIPSGAWEKLKEINVAINLGGGRYSKGDTTVEFDTFSIGLNIIPNE